MEEYYDGVVAKPELDELYHHGILDQKWGVRHGPPYPLGSDVSTGKRLISGGSGSVSKTKKRLAKASVKAAKANKKAAQSGNKILHPFKAQNKEKLQTKAFKEQAKVDKLQSKLAKEEKKEQKKEQKKEALNSQLDKRYQKLAAKDFDGEEIISLKVSNPGERGFHKLDPNTKEGQKILKEMSQKEMDKLVDNIISGKVKGDIHSDDPEVAKKIDKAFRKATGRDFDGESDWDYWDRVDSTLAKYDKELTEIYERDTKRLPGHIYTLDPTALDKKLKEISKETGISYKDLADSASEIYENEREVGYSAADKRYQEKKAEKKSIGSGGSGKAQDWIDAHTVTRETKNPEGAARMGEIDHNGNVIRTSKQMMDETIYRTMQAQARKTQETANSNQDMFNDILDRSSYGPGADKIGETNRAIGDKDFKKEIKRVAKESGVNRKDLENSVLDAYEKRNSEIAKNDTARQEQKQAQEKKASITKRLQNAKTRDQWDWNFLEATQNAPWTEAHTLGEMSDSAYKNKMLTEYKKYLQDPEEYWKRR